MLAEDIVLTLHPSKWLWGWLVLFSIWVIFSVLVSTRSAWAICVIVSYLFLLHRVYQQYFGPKRISKLYVNRYGDCFLSTGLQAMVPIQVLASSVAHPMLIVLHYREASFNPTPEHRHAKDIIWRLIGASHCLIILPDQAAATTSMTTLRRWLRWGQLYY